MAAERSNPTFEEMFLGCTNDRGDIPESFLESSLSVLKSLLLPAFHCSESSV